QLVARRTVAQPQRSCLADRKQAADRGVRGGRVDSEPLIAFCERGLYGTKRCPGADGCDEVVSVVAVPTGPPTHVDQYVDAAWWITPIDLAAFAARDDREVLFGADTDDLGEFGSVGRRGDPRRPSAAHRVAMTGRSHRVRPTDLAEQVCDGVGGG